MDLPHHHNPHRDRVIVAFQKLHPDARQPDYGSAEAAGADLYAIQPEVLMVGQRLMIPTGIAIQLPLGFEAQVRPRSGLAAKYGVTVLNAPGTIDSDYRGEIKVILINHGARRFEINPGDRIAQLVIAPVFQGLFMDAEHLTATGRGAGGFGSTGR